MTQTHQGKENEAAAWQEVSQAQLAGGDQWRAFLSIAFCTPVFWMALHLIVPVVRGPVVIWTFLTGYLPFVLFFCLISSLAMAATGRHRVNLLAWMVVPMFAALVSAPIVYFTLSGTTTGMEKMVGPVMAMNTAAGGLAWLLGIRLLPYLHGLLHRFKSGSGTQSS